MAKRLEYASQVPLCAAIATFTVVSVRAEASPLLTFRFGGIQFAAHFFNEEELEFDFVPNDIRGQDDLDSLLSFVRQMGDLLSKPVSITPENFRDGAFLVYRPDVREFRRIPRR